VQLKEQQCTGMITNLFGNIIKISASHCLPNITAPEQLS